MKGILAVVRIAFRRMLVLKGLTLLALTGVTGAVAFCTGIPLYTNTIYNRVLQSELYDQRRSIPVFGLLFRYKGDPEKPLAWDNIQPVSDYLTYHASSTLGLPKHLATRFIISPFFDIFPADLDSFEQLNALTELPFSTQSDVENHITLLAQLNAPAEDGILDVMVSEQLQLIQGWEPGQTFTALLEQRTAMGQKVTKIPIRISAIWRKTDPQDPYWFFNPTGLLEDTLLLPESRYAGQLVPLLDDDVSHALWYLVLDGDAFLPNQADSFLRRLETTTLRAGSLLPTIELMVAPAAKALRTYQAQARWLTTTLFALSVPVLCVILIFLGMVVRFMMQNQRAEIAILRSRGATEEQTLGIAACQGLLIGGFSLIGGLPLGRLFAMAITRTRGFLAFGGLSDIKLLITPTTTWIAIGVISGLVASVVILTMQLMKVTVVHHHQDVSRSLTKPWWQKAGLDYILLLVSLYGVMQMRVATPLPVIEGIPGETAADMILKQDPLLYLVPALCTLSLTLVALRVLPALSHLAAKGLAHTNRVAPLLAVRQVARQPMSYSAPIMLLVLTLSLAVFTSTLAITLRHHEHRQAYQSIGADLTIFELGENTEIEIDLEIEKLCIEDPELPCPWENQRAAERWIDEMGLRNRPHWRFLPLEEHFKVPGITAVTPVGRYGVEPLSRDLGETGVFLAIDRSTFVDVAYWEQNFAGDNLGTLMNLLAVTPEGVLVSSSVQEGWALQPGDTIPLQVIVAEPGTVGQYQTVNLSLKVAGFVDGFPSWSPEEGPLFVGNLDFLVQEAGGQFPYHVWFRTDDGTEPIALVKAVRDLGFKTQVWHAPSVRVEQTLNSPEFHGLMGMLSTGFLVSVGLTVLGMLLYLFFAFKDRSVEVATLRAIGLARRHVTGLMVWELVILMVLGSLGGTLTGLAISRGLIPYMRFGEIVTETAPPVLVHIAWQHIGLIYLLCAGLFGFMVLVLIRALSQLRLYAALKLGDTL